MSRRSNASTDRAAPHSFFPTDFRYTRGVLRALSQDGVALPGGTWCDPCVGSGAIVDAVEQARPGAQSWITCDIRPETGADVIADFPRTETACVGATMYITNPPFGPTKDTVFEFVSAALERRAPGGHVLFLIRFGFFAAACRIEFNRANPVDIYPMTPRPSFGLNKHGRPGTDGTDYVWAHWWPGASRRFGAPIDWRDA